MGPGRPALGCLVVILRRRAPGAYGELTTACSSRATFLPLALWLVRLPKARYGAALRRQAPAEQLGRRSDLRTGSNVGSWRIADLRLPPPLTSSNGRCGGSATL